MAIAIEELLQLEQLDTNLFRSQHHFENFKKTLFGGQVLGQGLMAAFQTQKDDFPNSLHAYFLRPGVADTPVIYDVENVRDGKSFSCRRVLARQFGRPIFNLSSSFHKPEGGLSHHEPYPDDIPTPEEVLKQDSSHSIGDKIFHTHSESTPFEFLPTDSSLFSKQIINPPQGYFWIKSRQTLSDSPINHICALAFASDMGLLASALLPHNATIFDENLIVASIDHAMWFHETDFRVDEWLLCKVYSPWAGSARGYAQAHIFDQKKRLIASTVQEGLIRQI